jgi:hypothetical protein
MPAQFKTLSVGLTIVGHVGRASGLLACTSLSVPLHPLEWSSRAATLRAGADRSGHSGRLGDTMNEVRLARDPGGISTNARRIEHKRVGLRAGAVAPRVSSPGVFGPGRQSRQVPADRWTGVGPAILSASYNSPPYAVRKLRCARIGQALRGVHGGIFLTL